jgi:16S rRNA (cytosine1402-N4)-methyltransferase
MGHITVLKDEAVTALALTPAATVVDATYGGGGHSQAILEVLGPQGTLLSLDADETAFITTPVTDARQRGIVANFRDIATVLAREGIPQVDAILADLGWRSDQFASGGKGFSFGSDEPLVMTFGTPEAYTFTAHDVVNSWEEENLADIIYAYGEERFARRIARAIVGARAEGDIATASALARIIETAVPGFARHGRLHPATKTFQAIRIVVNDELGALRTLITDGFAHLAPHGRLAIITFHSLEDRIVKQMFRTLQHDQGATRITKKPIIPSDREVADNPRARSAKLRILEKAL